MRLPRDVNGDELARLLTRYGYRIDHQTGSHERLSAIINHNTHDLTIPRHKPLRVGTLHGILRDVAEHREIPLVQVITELSG